MLPALLFTVFLASAAALPEALDAKVPHECGTVTPDSAGSEEKHDHLPWYAAVYRKTTKPYSLICGGSLVTTTTVISAAHCFWIDADGAQPAENYAVALGKVQWRLNNKPDSQAHVSNVSAIRIPTNYRGASTNYQSDIAVVILESPAVYQTNIRPVCINFDASFDAQQLQKGKLGKIAGWDTSAHDKPLQVVESSFTPHEQCLAEAPSDFHEYFLADKFCAGSRDARVMCRGNAGNGLAFPEEYRGVQRYYLRGIESVAPYTLSRCSEFALFTQIAKHEHFLAENLTL